MKSYTVPPRGIYIGSLDIRFYGILMAVSMLIGILLAIKLAKKRGIKSDDIYLLALIVLPCAIIGARLYYFIFGEISFSEFFNFRSGGLAVLGGVIGGIIGIVIFCAVKKNFKILIDLFDICVPCLILGQGIGRIGCFFSQCCYGELVTNPNLQWLPFAMQVETYEGSGVYTWHLATNLYESLWNFLGFGLLLTIYLKTKQKLIPTASYFIYYGTGRAIIEGFRGDSLFIGNSTIRVSQAVSIIMIVIGLAILVFSLYKYFKNKPQKQN